MMLWGTERQYRMEKASSSSAGTYTSVNQVWDVERSTFLPNDVYI